MRMLTGCNCETSAIGHTGLPLNVTQASEIPARRSVLMKPTVPHTCASDPERL
jgi:hypothetical protein